MRKIELLIKPVSYDCNLSCEYCFYKGTNSLYPTGKHVMNEIILETLIGKALAYSDGGLAVFSWQGGEPLVAGTGFFRKVVELQKKLGKPGQRVGNSIQTNGTLLDDEIIALMKEYNFFLGLSIDGNETSHNKYRGNSFKKAMEASVKLRTAGVEFNILTVINEHNSKDPRALYDFYMENGFAYVQFIPCAETDKTGRLLPFSVSPEAYGNFLSGFFDLWYNGGAPKLGVRLFDNILEVLSGSPAGYCGFKDSCKDYLVVEHNGDVFPCDFFVSKDWKLGNIAEDGFDGLFAAQASRFSGIKADTAPKCKACEWAWLCKGGCPKYRLANKGTLNSADIFCKSYKAFFRHSMERLKQLTAGANKKEQRT